MKFPCPFCGGRIGATEEWFGQKVPCPHCGKQIQVPGEAQPGKSKPDDSGAPPLKAPRSRQVQLAVVIILGIVITGFALLVTFSSVPSRGAFSGASVNAAPAQTQTKRPAFSIPLAKWLSLLKSRPKVISCRLVDCLFDKAGQRELGLADSEAKIFVAVRMGIPARFFIPGREDYQTMQRSSSGNEPLPAPEQCRWFDAGKFQLTLANGSSYSGLVLCRLCQNNVPGAASGSAWGSTIGEITFSVAPTAVNLERIEELEVCFAVNKTEAQSRPYRLTFAGLEFPVPVE